MDTAKAARLSAAEIKALAEKIYAALDAGKAEDIVSIHIGGRSALADYMIIAGGTSARHVMALADNLLRDLKQWGVKHIKTEGLESGEWALIDAGDVIIHLFRPETRAFYRLENMWTEAEQGKDKAPAE